MDFGGAIEVYTTKRQLIRIDLSDTHFYYHTTHVTQPDGSIVTLQGGVRQHSIQTSVSYAWRFQQHASRGMPREAASRTWYMAVVI